MTETPTQPAVEPAPPPVPPEPAPSWSLRRAARTPAAETWEIGADGAPAGKVFLQYGDRGVDGVLALAGEADEDRQRSVLAWLTDALALDEAAGPAGLIHWHAVGGEITEFWRRSPGRRASGAETDVAAVRARVEAVLASLFGQYAVTPDNDLAVDVGTVRVFAAIRLVDTTPVVRVFSITNVDLPPDPDLGRFLSTANFGLLVGRFSYDQAQRAVWFDHVLVSDEVDEGSLSRVVSAVAGTADRLDEEIKGRFGGRTFREEGSPVEMAAHAGDMAGGYL